MILISSAAAVWSFFTIAVRVSHYPTNAASLVLVPAAAFPSQAYSLVSFLSFTHCKRS